MLKISEIFSVENSILFNKYKTICNNFRSKVSLLVMLISSWLTMGDYRQVFLFKSYCSLFYGLHLWKFNSSGFDKCCKSENIAKLLHIPFNTHVWVIGPLIKQTKPRVQLQFRNFQFLLNAFKSTNGIVYTIY